MLFKDYKIGFADAEKEYLRTPEIFKDAFFDVNGILDELINKYKFMLIGKKGVGKTAYNAKLQSLSDENDNFFVEPLQLNDFEFTTFAKIKVDDDLSGTKKYKDAWEFIILHKLYNILFKKMKFCENQHINERIIFLNKIGFPIDLDYKENTTKLSKLKVGINIVNFDLEFQDKFQEKPTTFLERLSKINKYLIDGLNGDLIFFDRNKIFLTIDGVDDILRIKKFKNEIILGLIRCIDNLILCFERNKAPIKIILLIREDIVNQLTDPDLAKIKRDGSISLDWSRNLEGLKGLVNLRFKISGVNDNEVANWWESIFPKHIQKKESWEYVLDYTLYRPRDILQFLKTCQILYPEKESLTYSEIQSVLNEYSTNYFIEEMKNELTGFIREDLIIALPTILQKLGSRSFYLNKFYNIAMKQPTIKKLSIDEVKSLLMLLYTVGYVGQLHHINRKGNTSVIFKYRSPRVNIDYSLEFITHRGLFKGLGIADN